MRGARERLAARRFRRRASLARGRVAAAVPATNNRGARPRHGPCSEAAPMRTPLEALLRPKSVAVVGASRSRASVGGEIFANLVRRPFAGTVYPVNASAHEVQGVRAYPSIAELPEAVDLAVVAVPAPRVHGSPPAMRDRGNEGGRGHHRGVRRGRGSRNGCPTAAAPRGSRCVPSDRRPELSRRPQHGSRGRSSRHVRHGVAGSRQCVRRFPVGGAGDRPAR